MGAGYRPIFSALEAVCLPAAVPLRPSGSPAETAPALLGGLEGAMLVARPYGVRRFEAAAAGLLTGIAVVAPR